MPRRGSSSKQRYFESKVIDIAVVSVSGLGFREGATYEQLTSRALESGLVECPIELAPHSPRLRSMMAVKRPRVFTYGGLMACCG
jgi:hypothetical protein